MYAAPAAFGISPATAAPTDGDHRRQGPPAGAGRARSDAQLAKHFDVEAVRVPDRGPCPDGARTSTPRSCRHPRRRSGNHATLVTRHAPRGPRRPFDDRLRSRVLRLAPVARRVEAANDLAIADGPPSAEHAPAATSDDGAARHAATFPTRRTAERRTNPRLETPRARVTAPAAASARPTPTAATGRARPRAAAASVWPPFSVRRAG